MLRINNFFLFSFFLLAVSCGKRPLAPPIGNNMSFPGSLVALDSNNFLLLNTSANGDYSDGSIQRYSVDASGNYSLQNVLSVPAHGSELAVSSDSKLVALSFDASYNNTELKFYSYSNPSSPSLLSNLTLSFPKTGGKQVIKRLSFFQRTADPASYYIYGSILTFANDDGTNGGIPERSFVAKIANNSSQILFILSYGLNDPNSLVQQSSSLNSQVTQGTTQYTFGFSSPTYDSTHDLFIAFPTGTSGGYNNVTNGYPGLPDPLNYFGGKDNKTYCSGPVCKIQPDYRSVSLAAVDMSAIISGTPLNKSTYFVPMGWNQNGIPYAAKSNNISIVQPNETTNADKNSFTFQTGFWSSYWANTKNNGSGGASCFTTTASSDTNQYSILGDNSLFVVKSGTNGGNDASSNGKSGNGNEVFIISGLDILSNNIAAIKTAVGNGTITIGGTDFKDDSKYLLLDPFFDTEGKLPAVKTSWLTGASTTKNAGPLTPYMFSRTSNVGAFDTTATAVGNISVLNFGTNKCLPYWARNTYLAGSFGRDTAWLTANPVTLSLNANGTYPNATIDPTQPSVYSFTVGSGAQMCTDLTTTTNTPRVFCVNFLTSAISKYNVSQAAPVFTLF